MTFSPLCEDIQIFAKGQRVMDVLIEFEKKPLSFTSPSSLICARHPQEIKKCFTQIQTALKNNKYVAGFMSYEAGYSFEEKLYTQKTYDFPLIYMGVYDKPQCKRLWKRAKQKNKKIVLKNLVLNCSRKSYGRDIETIRSHIAAGDVYQITYCIKYHGICDCDTRELYDVLYHNQPVPYPAYIESKDFTILSLSPERFFKKTGTHILTEPMKGTWRRGKTIWTDVRARYQLKHDIKNRAENMMICDLLRNDLGRIGRTIRVPKLYTVKGYNTLFQMTSTVTAQVEKNIDWYHLFSSLFPSGSVTGAPKIRAMEIIRSLEGEDRNIYTGAIGYIAPDNDAYFNIPIRTLLVRNKQVEVGIGGGIVWDSTAQGEWDEGQLKSKFIFV